MYYIDRHSNGSAENDEHDGDRDDGGSLSRSASENSVARRKMILGLILTITGIYDKKFQCINLYVFCRIVLIYRTILTI